MKLDVVKLTKEIVNFPSESLTSNVAVSKHSQGILENLGFEVESLQEVIVDLLKSCFPLRRSVREDVEGVPELVCA